MNLEGIIAFIFVFGIIVFVHELGHFIFAKLFKVIVFEFSIGMGPEIFGLNKGGTNYSVRLLPVGGYVLLAGPFKDNEYLRELRPGKMISYHLDNFKKIDVISFNTNNFKENFGLLRIKKIFFKDTLEIEGSFSDNSKSNVTFALNPHAKLRVSDNKELIIPSKFRQLQNISYWKQALINLAGPLMNLILALFLFLAISFGISSVPINSNQINITPNYPAAQAGLQNGDHIKNINSNTVKNWSDISRNISNLKEKKIKIGYVRNNDKEKFIYTHLKPKKINGEKKYLLGIQEKTSSKVKNKIIFSFSNFTNNFFLIWSAIFKLIRHPNLNQLGGPVEIARISNTAAKSGFISIFQLIAFLSLNIGIFNLIPIPVFDGGKILLNFLSLIRGKPLSNEINEFILILSVIFIFLLMIAVTVNDLMR